MSTRWVSRYRVLVEKAKHLDNLLALIKINDYDETVMNWIHIYCEMNGLIKTGETPNWQEIAEVKHVLGEEE